MTTSPHCRCDSGPPKISVSPLTAVARWCLGSPDCWFEDFGEAQLVDGEADVPLDPEFAALIVVEGYHVFVTPYGDSNGLFVAERGRSGFRVYGFSAELIEALVVAGFVVTRPEH
jgi:hypothetical protein